MIELVLVAAGGAIGASLRYVSGIVAIRLLGTDFPWATAFVNVAGSFLMGLFIEALARRYGVSNEVRLFVATGFLGGFTTFSSFSLDAVVLIERGTYGLAFLYVAGSVLLGIAALFAGMALGRAVI